MLTLAILANREGSSLNKIKFYNEIFSHAIAYANAKVRTFPLISKKKKQTNVKTFTKWGKSPKTRLSKGEVKGISGYKQLQMRHFAFEMLILKAVGFANPTERRCPRQVCAEKEGQTG